VGFLFDPPGAVPPMTGLFPDPKTSTTKSAAAEATPSLDEATKTTSASPQPTTINPLFVPESSTSALPLDPTSPDNGPEVMVPSPTSGVYIGGTDSSSTYFPNPAVVQVPIATIANSVIYASPGATVVLVGSQTLSINGPAVTFSSKAIQLTPSNIFISEMNSGSASTLELPSQSTAGVPPVAIATIGSQTISAAPGASTVVVQGQTLSAGGPPIMPSANIVASLGISGIIIQYPGGGVSSVALPTAVPQMSSLTTALSELPPICLRLSKAYVNTLLRVLSGSTPPV
jgi:uncharacterized Zn-binding protein involved in type VI secretion